MMGMPFPVVEPGRRPWLNFLVALPWFSELLSPAAVLAAGTMLGALVVIFMVGRSPELALLYAIILLVIALGTR